MRRTRRPKTNFALALGLTVAGLTAATPGRAGWRIDLGELDSLRGCLFEGIEDGALIKHAVATGDVNGDGFDDLIVGSGGAGPIFEGAVSVTFGGGSLPLKTLPADLDGGNGFRIRPDRVQHRGYFGQRVATGDLNGDGFDDVIIGAPSLDPAGQVFVLFGRESFPAEVDFATGVADGERGFIIDGRDEDDDTGSVIAAVDLNGDGLDELIVNKDNYGVATKDRYVYYGRPKYPARFLVTATGGDRGFRIQGVDEVDRNRTYGIASPGGDVNGDGFNDLLLASGIDVYDPMPQEGYVIYGAASHPAVIDLEQLDGDNGFTMIGSSWGDWGTPVVSAGDVDGDGFDDILFQDDSFADDSAGSTALIYGAESFPSSLSLAEAGTGQLTIIMGESYGRKLRGDIAGVGDVDGDGLDDVILGAEWVQRAGELVGAAYVSFGSSDRPETIHLGYPQSQLVLAGSETDSQIGNAVAGGDVNGDGVSDMVVSGSAYGPGRTYVVYGRPFADRF